jgi:radical SAM superfamily enzyme YgiQ (UPF0313 family)
VHVTLLFPPVTDPRSPHLALPSLAASLRADGVHTVMRDLDLEGLIFLVAPENLQPAADILRGVATASQPAALRRLVALSERTIAHATGALASLRTRRFYDPHAYAEARGILADALEMVSLASKGVRYNIAPIRYDVQGCDPASLRDLVRVTATDEHNLFAQHWRSQLFPGLARQRPDLVGISITNRQQLLPGLLLARRLREQGHFVVLGGTLFTKFVDSLRAQPSFFEHFADAIVIYEGETALRGLTQEVVRGRKFDEIPNLLYLDAGRVRQNAIHVEDVNRLHTPDFAGLPLDEYLAPAPVLPILTGKGCYFNRCKFCDIPYINHVAKKAYRIREPELVVNDLRTLRQRHNTMFFEITDEALAPRLLEKVADQLLERPEESYRFVGYARLEAGFDQRLCEKLHRVGFRKLFFGLESGAQKTLEAMDKGIDVTTAEHVLRDVSNAGINFHLFSMIGFPEETTESAEETFAFFPRNKASINRPGNSFDIHPFGLELRTKFFTEAESLGVVINPLALRKDFLIGLSAESWKNTRGMPTGEIEARIEKYLGRLKEVFAEYHNTPGHLWPGFEEYALLYAEYYAKRLFTFRTALPVHGTRQRYRVVPSALTWIEAEGPRLRLYGQDGVLGCAGALFEFLLRPIWATREAWEAELAALLGQTAGAESAADLYGRVVARLVGMGLVRIELEEAHDGPLEGPERLVVAPSAPAE